ncbi:MAG: alpha/beta fold hydrolase [Chloroflexi bacterium]|nr:alpha/beta fold hydrolase [Chloroflexota bacterium]
MIRGVSVAVDGIQIKGEMHVPGGVRGRWPGLCICHGIPSGKPAEPSDRGYAALAERFCAGGLATTIFSFRGTGESGGNFDIMGWVRDLGAVIDFLVACPEVDGTNISVMGFSGGAAVSAYVAAHDLRVARVVLCACPAEFRGSGDGKWWQSSLDHFRNIGIIRDDGFPMSVEAWVGGFTDVAPLRWVREIAPRPLLFMHGSLDDVVEISDARRLYEQAGEPKELLIIDGGGHRLRLYGEAMDMVFDWLRHWALSIDRGLSTV